jgi:glycosyltransferase involved in cell wall biosynthesis
MTNDTYLVQSPILFLVFNRPDVTAVVFEEIKKARPRKLYVAADGARNESELDLCRKTREVATKVDWDCEVITLFRDKNLGCKYAVSSAISWFFENEEQGIILEDDCLPSNDFFRFCDEMLNRYKEDVRIRFVGGSNFQEGTKRGDASYYFSNLSHVWGWASWRRVWEDYDVELTNFKELDHYQLFNSVFNNLILASDWYKIIQKLYNNEIDTWDYQLSITNLFKKGLSVIPNANLISNIGFGKDATHTFDANGFENVPYGILDQVITHPPTFISNKEADFFTLNKEHNIEGRKDDRIYVPVSKKEKQNKIVVEENVVKLTIITINYNNNEGLIKTIESVINQTWNDFEFIIIDGGSTDESVSTIKKYDKYINYWVSENDKGVYDAMNKAIQLSKGTYVNFMNSGDYYFTNTVLEEIQHKFINNIGILYGDSFYFNDQGYDKIEKTPSKFSFTHFVNSGINHQASFIKRDLFFKYFMYNIEYKIGADWEFFLYVICKKNETYEHVGKTICYYDFSGMSAVPENLHLYNTEREIILNKHFPLFYEDFVHCSTAIDRRIKKVLRIKNNVILWRLLKFWTSVCLLMLPKQKNKQEVLD